MVNKNSVFHLNKLLYICCARSNGRTVKHIIFYEIYSGVKCLVTQVLVTNQKWIFSELD